MAKRILNCLREHKRLPLCAYEWKSLMGEKIVDMLSRKSCLNFTDRYDYVSEIKTEKMSLFISPLNGRFFGIDEDGESEQYFDESDVRKLLFDKESFAKQIAESIGLNKTPPTALPYGTDGFYLGELKLVKTYQLFLCYNFSHFEKELSAIIKNGNIPIVYCFDSSNITPSASLAIDEKLGYKAELADSFVIGERQIICTCPPADIVEFKGSLRAREEFKYSRWPYATSKHKWQDLEITLLSESEFEAKLDGKSLDINFRDIAFFCSAKDKPSSLWRFFIKALFGKANPTNDTDVCYQKRLNSAFRGFFGIDSVAFSSRGNDSIEPTFSFNTQRFSEQNSESRRIRKQIFSS